MQYVHRGETVQFSFVLKRPLAGESISGLGLADYCVFDIGGDRDAVGLDPEGAFTYEHTFDDVKLNQPIRATATAYRLVGTQDQMNVAGEWIKNDSPYDEPDVFVATASVRLIPYQAIVSIDLPVVWKSVDLDHAVLTLFRERDEKQTRVLRQRGQISGFVIQETDQGGRRIIYTPKWDEVNTTAPTDVSFSVLDATGQEYRLVDRVITP